MWFDILKSFEGQLKQKIKELDVNKVFDIKFESKNEPYALIPPTISYNKDKKLVDYKFDVSLDTSEFFYLDQSGTKRELEAGDKHGPYTMSISVYYDKETPIAMGAELYLEVIKPEFKTTAYNLENFAKQINGMLMDYYLYLRETYFYKE